METIIKVTSDAPVTVEVIEVSQPDPTPDPVPDPTPPVDPDPTPPPVDPDPTPPPAQPAGWDDFVMNLRNMTFIDATAMPTTPITSVRRQRSDAILTNTSIGGGGVIWLNPGADLDMMNVRFVNGGVDQYQAIKIDVGASFGMQDFEFTGPMAQAYMGNIIKCEARAPDQAGTIRYLKRGRFVGPSSDTLKIVPDPGGCLIEDVHFGAQWSSGPGAHCDLNIMPMMLGDLHYRRVCFERTHPTGAPNPPTYNAAFMAATNGSGAIGAGHVLFEEVIFESGAFDAAQILVAGTSTFQPTFGFRNVLLDPRKFWYRNILPQVTEWTNVRNIYTGDVIAHPADAR